MIISYLKREEKPTMPKANVKIMLSYDYYHFEVCLGSDEDLSLQQMDIIDFIGQLEKT